MKQHTGLYYPVSEKTTVSRQAQPAPDGYGTTAQCDATLRTCKALIETPLSDDNRQKKKKIKKRLCKTAKAHLSARRMPLRYG